MLQQGLVFLNFILNVSLSDWGLCLCLNPPEISGQISESSLNWVNEIESGTLLVIRAIF